MLLHYQLGFTLFVTTAAGDLSFLLEQPVLIYWLIVLQQV